MRKHIALAAIGLALTAAPALAGPNDIELFGKDPGNDLAAACFMRHYDDAHMAAHPGQNVTDMAVLVDARSNEDGERTYKVGLGVKFRGLQSQMQAEAYCGLSLDGETVLGCGIDCDGGQVDVDMQQGSMVVSIPYGAAVWDPNATDEEPGTEPATATFGEDDKTFRLDRVDLSECTGLAYEDDLVKMVAAN
jgi:hypothetical protein